MTLTYERSYARAHERVRACGLCPCHVSCRVNAVVCRVVDIRPAPPLLLLLPQTTPSRHRPPHTGSPAMRTTTTIIGAVVTPHRQRHRHRLQQQQRGLLCRSYRLTARGLALDRAAASAATSRLRTGFRARFRFRVLRLRTRVRAGTTGLALGRRFATAHLGVCVRDRPGALRTVLLRRKRL